MTKAPKPELADPVVTPEPPPGQPSSRWQWLKDLAPKAVLESILIVFSVILALSVSDWADQRRTAHRVEEMRGYLIREIRTNRDNLDTPGFIPRHEGLKRAFYQGGGTPERIQVTRAMAEPAIAQLFGGGGLNLMTPRDAVWRSVSASDLFEHMDPEEVFMLAQVYKAQESLESVNQAGYDNALGLLDILSSESNTHRSMMRMTLYLEDLLQQERNLLRIYNQALMRMDPAGERAAGRDVVPAKG